MLRIAPSLAAAPLDRLGETVRALDAAGADLIHFDVEDGSFAPVMTLGTKLIADLRPISRRPFDVHLMMVQPEWLIPQLARDGADRISVHFEACPYPRRTLRMITEAGAAAGMAFNPATPIPDLTGLLPHLKFVVVLTTEPEIPDPTFLPYALEKIRQGKRTPGLEGVEWVADGGLKPENVRLAAEAGADTLVIGRSVFREGRISENLNDLRRALAEP
jgi:ribulose-phosphate 3-epimerase